MPRNHSQVAGRWHAHPATVMQSNGPHKLDKAAEAYFAQPRQSEAVCAKQAACRVQSALLLDIQYGVQYLHSVEDPAEL